MRQLLIGLISSVILCCIATLSGADVYGDGNDLYAPLRRAVQGKPLRVLTLGGSITQGGGGNGWIGDAMRQQFPDAPVSIYNAGMSAMDSRHATYRLQRDVIDNQPDIVIIEFTVNDKSKPDQETLRTVESLIRKLKTLKNPPAVIMLEAADRDRPAGAVPPQRLAGLHYGLLNIDLNTALNRHLSDGGPKFEDLMSDRVHPNNTGHQFYAQTIMAALKPYIERSRSKETLPAPPELPPQLSGQELTLDGRLGAIPATAGWQLKPVTPGWYSRFFLGTTASRTPGDVLEIPFRGQTAGIFFEMSTANGLIYASVDGAPPVPVNINSRNGYSYAIIAKGLAPGEHIMRVVIPQGGSGQNGAQLGYLMTSGDPGEPGQLAGQGEWSKERLAQLKCNVVAANLFAWQGPFGDLDQKWQTDDIALAELYKTYPPDAGSAANDRYQKITGDELIIDFSRFTKLRDRGVVYAKTLINSPCAQTVRLRLVLDYYALIYLNGQKVSEIVTHHGNPADGVFIELPLTAGKNELVIKIHSGSGGCSLGAELAGADHDGVTFENPLP